MFNRKKAWFRAFSPLLAALTTCFICGREYGEAQAATRLAGVRLQEAAARMKIDPRQVSDPEAWASEQKALAAERQKQAIAQMRRFTHADEQEARAKAARELALKLKNAQPKAPLLRELARAQSLKVSKDELTRRLTKASPAFRAALNVAKPELPPGAKPLLVPEREAPLRFQASPPRMSPLHGQLTPEVKELYAQMLGEGAFALQDDGSLLPVEQVIAGVRPPPPVQLAGLMSDLGLPMQLMGPLPAPGPDDLAQTPETVRTPKITALASSLQNKALAIFNYVHAQIAPELYYGSKKGGAATLEEKAGNDFDQASLLIALLRAASIPARYEYGTVELSIPQVESLTGIADARDAARLMSQAGIPALASTDGRSVTVERAWVRAYVPYSDYRGTGVGGDSLWVRLDPALKRIRHSQVVNLRGLVHFDFPAFLQRFDPVTHVLDPATPREVYEGQLLAAAKASNLCNSLDDALDKATLAEEAAQLLPAEHPAKVVQSLLVFARPPQSFRFQVTLSLGAESHTFELPELQYHTLAMRYPGATYDDEAAIAAAGGIANVVPYMVKVAPTLMLDGVQAKRFADVGPGNTQRLVVRVTVPNGSPAVAAPHLIAGSVYALNVSAGTVAQSWMDAQRRSAQQLTGDLRVEAYGQIVAALYARQQVSDSTRLFALQGHAAVQDVLIALAGRELKVVEALGIPVDLAWGLYFIDVPHETLTPLPKDGNTSMQAELTKLSGHHGSFLEGKVWESVFSTASISAVRLMQAARAISPTAVPVYTLTSPTDPNRSNLVGFSAGTFTDIDQALAAGWTVTIPKNPVNYLQYQNREAYILQNPATGAGAYRINTALNGGGSSGPDDIPAPPDCPACAGSEPAVGSTVNMANGNMRESWTELSLPGVGLPIVWARTYASRATGMTELGYGWMHSYGMYLRPEAGGSFTYVTEDWREVRFSWNGTGYTAAPGWYLTLTNLADGHRLRTKGGLIYEFNTAHRLRSIQEPSGNTVTIVYTSGRMNQILDSNGQVALAFGYTGNKITTVTDRANRTVSYMYVADDLTRATDTLNHFESYGYDSNHNLIQRTDKRGKVWTHYYDIRDRWVGKRDPLGNESSVVYDTVNRRTVYFDRTGAAWIREHDASGSPVALVDPLGNRTEMTWQSFTKTKEKDSRGYETVMTYDARGNLLSKTAPDTRVTAYEYDPTFNQVTKITETGLPTITNTYYSDGKLHTHTDGVGTTTYAYTTRGLLDTATQAGPAVTSLTYKPDGSIWTVTDPTNRTTTFGYDTAGHVTSIQNPANHVRTFEVDSEGRTGATVDALLNRTEFTYDDAGNRLTAKDPALHITQYGYDDAGRLVQVTDALNHVTKTTYDAEGRVIAQTDARGGRTVTEYDAAGRAIKTTVADGSTTQYAYCAAVADATPCAEIDALGNLTTKELDTGGRVLRVTDALGRATTYTYDQGGRLETSTGPNQVPLTYTYASSGLLSSVANSVLTITYAYEDGRGNRTKVTADGQVTRYAYDLANRLLSEAKVLSTTPLVEKTTIFTYNTAGDRETKTDANNKVTQYAYNVNRKLRTITFQDGTKYEYDYDSRGNRTLERSPDHERTLAYDPLNRVEQVNDVTMGKVITYGYDRNGNRSSITEGSLLHRYEYDALNRLKQAIDSTGNAIAFDYDALGRRRAMVRPNGVRSTYSYDAAGQLLSTVHAKGQSVLVGFNYEYDAHGNRRSKGREDGTKEVYGYDAVDRLVSVNYGANRAVRYGLDDWGNRQQLDETGIKVRHVLSSFNALNQLTQSTENATVTTYAYNNNGDLQTETVGASVKEYVWSLDDRLRQVIMPGGLTYSYEYDANGLRTKKVEAGVSTRYLLDGASILEELDGSGATRRSYFTHLQVVDEVLSFSEASANYYPLTDAMGSVVAITDSGGAAVRTNSYDVYGTKTTSGSGPELALGFAGREHDAWGGIKMRQRDLDPSLGRWTQADPLGMVDGPNLYQYVRGNPVSYTDPTGLLVGVVPVRAPIPVYDSWTATALYHPILFLALLASLGISSDDVVTGTQECDDYDLDGLEVFFRGDSLSRAQRSVTEGFIAAGVGTDPSNQLGSGLYMAREPDIAVPYAMQYAQRGAGGALLEITISSKIWRQVMLLGGQDNVPVSPGSGMQTFVPAGPALTLFDAASAKQLLVRY